ncbi:MAG: nitrophenyl compound nitroreductase subunit ArsF family protein [Bacteroidetes bacterium]|nr:nitrophenyl compound nitroreductase subunit ArsF family protein [Bacteroidota bacterium]
MKKYITILFMLLFAIGSVISQQKPTGKSIVEVYYFHGKMRCPTCLSIEDNAKKTVDTYFKDQKAKGLVKMIVIDIDDEKNKALVEKYEVSSSSLFVTRITGGKTFTFDMTNFAFSYSRNEPDKFITGLKDKINESLTK